MYGFEVSCSTFGQQFLSLVSEGQKPLSESPARNSTSVRGTWIFDHATGKKFVSETLAFYLLYNLPRRHAAQK